VVEENKKCRGRQSTYKKQGGIQISEILGNQVIVVFVGNLPVDGPKFCGWVGLYLLRFPASNCFLKPRAKSDRAKFLGNMGKD